MYAFFGPTYLSCLFITDIGKLIRFFNFFSIYFLRIFFFIFPSLNNEISPTACIQPKNCVIPPSSSRTHYQAFTLKTLIIHSKKKPHSRSIELENFYFTRCSYLYINKKKYHRQYVGVLMLLLLEHLKETEKEKEKDTMTYTRHIYAFTRYLWNW